MAFKVNTTVVVTNSGNANNSCIVDHPSTMPTSVSVSGSPGNGFMYRISVSGHTVSIY